MYIKHSKFKNSGILFEVLVKKITSDTLSGKTSHASNILRKYFVNTELGREYKLYESVFKLKNISEIKANTILTTVIEASQKLNKTKLKREKYNLIKDLKEHYNVEDLFKTKLYDYKAQASLYTLFELYSTEHPVNHNQIIDNKITLLEYLTKSPVEKNEVKEDIFEEFKSYDKDIRTLTYKIMVEKFNDKYSNLNNSQKNILKEFIESVDSTSYLKTFYNVEIQKIKSILEVEIPKVKDETTKIKLLEVSKLIKELDKNHKIKNDHLIDLLQYHNLLEELKSING
jgi:hypothetical protein